MQDHYVHSLPRINKSDLSEAEADKYRRIALIFRHGREEISTEAADEGVTPESLKGNRKATVEELHPFGPMREVLTEGETYSRVHLLQLRAFSSTQGGISGTIDHGCSAIVVSRQSRYLHEFDQFSVLSYSSTAAQSAGAMFRTFSLQQNLVRVFRSTALEGSFRALFPQSAGKHPAQMYRYDGLYRIEGCFARGSNGEWYVAKDRPKGKELFTFVLSRADRGNDSNQLSAEEHVLKSMKSGTIDASALLDFYATFA